MKNLFDHIENLRGKPHHVRRQVAYALATFGSAFIALVWLVGNYTTGTFALKESSFALSVGQGVAVATTSSSGNQGLAGAAAALEDKNAPAHIEIVDTTPAAPKKQSEKTVLPF